MTYEQALLFLIEQLYNKSSCGRLDKKEREAVRIIRKKINEDGKSRTIRMDK